MEKRKQKERKNGELKSVPIQVTAHDIVSLINHAKQYNTNNFGEEIAQWPGKNENYLYVQIDIKNSQNAEKWNDSKKNDFLNDNSLNIGPDDAGTIRAEKKYYMCTKCEISPVTKRVIYMKFEDYKE